MADERSTKTPFRHSQWNRGVQRLRTDESTGWRRVGLIALTAAVYFATARVGLEYAVVAGVVTLTWLPSGLALAFLLTLGTGVWPGIAAGAFLVNASIGIPLPVVAGINNCWEHTRGSHRGCPFHLVSETQRVAPECSRCTGAGRCRSHQRDDQRFSRRGQSDVGRCRSLRQWSVGLADMVDGRHDGHPDWDPAADVFAAKAPCDAALPDPGF